MSRLNKSKIDTNDSIKNPKKKKWVVIILLVLILVLAVRTAFSAHKWQEIATQMVKNESSKVLDTDGNIIAEIGTERNRKNIKLSDIPENLKNAYIAIEDERFYKHGGVDLKRTIAAIGSYAIHFGNASFGASTITQQLVKNLTGDNSSNISRKIKEWSKATELEWCMSKDEILESYLNIIYVGPNIYGVEMGANYYFNKSVSDLSLAECAFLAGINNAPNAYNPFDTKKDNSEKITKRVKIVLNKMRELGNITEDEYNAAIADVQNGFDFQKGKIEKNSSVYSYHTDALISEVVSDIAENKKISSTFATNYLYMADLKIYSTQNSSIQKNIEDEFAKKQYLLRAKDGENTSQAAMVVMDHKTGQVVGCVGGLGKKEESRGFNRATQAIRQTGSSSKPLAVVIPALAEKIITPISKYTDEQTTFIDNNNEEYSPTDYNNYLGEITVRRAIESSQNIPFVKIMEQLTPATSIKYLKKMGITTLTDRDENLALALGGLDKGISPLEMAGAYSAIANDGVYVEPTFYTEIVSATGKTILKSKQKSNRAFSEQVAYVTKKLLTQPVTGNNGTATYCSITGMEVAAKTGTTNEDYDRWLCGFTNYYTAVTWFGYDMSEPIRYNGKNPAGIIWANVMRKVHSKLENSEFETENNVVALKVCKNSLKSANSGCTDTYTEYFLNGTQPDECVIHKGTTLKNIEVIDENKKQKIKDTLKDTIESVKSEILEDSSQETTPVQEVVPGQTQTPTQTPEVPVQEERRIEETTPKKEETSNEIKNVENTATQGNNEPDNVENELQLEESDMETEEMIEEEKIN